MHGLGQIFFFHFSGLSLLSLSGILIPGSYLKHYSIKVPLKPHYFISMVALGSTLTTLRLLQRAAFVLWCKYLLFPKTFCHDKLKWNINEQTGYAEIWLTDDLVCTRTQASPLLCRPSFGAWLYLQTINNQDVKFPAWCMSVFSL